MSTPRPGTTVESLGGLNPSFAGMIEMQPEGFDRPFSELCKIRYPDVAEINHVHHAGNSSGVVDGASAVLVTPDFAKAHGLKPRARDIDLWEINEAFASVVLKFMKDLDVSHDDVNIDGGAIALGHPIGATGGMLVGTAVDQLHREDKETALIAMCTGGGTGTATIIERM